MSRLQGIRVAALVVVFVLQSTGPAAGKGRCAIASQRCFPLSSAALHARPVLACLTTLPAPLLQPATCAVHLRHSLLLWTSQLTFIMDNPPLPACLTGW